MLSDNSAYSYSNYNDYILPANIPGVGGKTLDRIIEGWRNECRAQ